MSPEPFTLPKSILIVDDDQNQRRSLTLILRRAGYLVAACGQACEALQHLQSGSYNLIIMGYNLTREPADFTPGDPVHVSASIGTGLHGALVA